MKSVRLPLCALTCIAASCVGFHNATALPAGPQVPHAANAVAVVAQTEQRRMVRVTAVPELTHTFRFGPTRPSNVGVTWAGDTLAAGVMTRVRLKIMPVHGAVLW